MVFLGLLLVLGIAIFLLWFGESCIRESYPRERDQVIPINEALRPAAHSRARSVATHRADSAARRRPPVRRAPAYRTPMRPPVAASMPSSRYACRTFEPDVTFRETDTSDYGAA